MDERVRPATILHVDMDAFYAAVEMRDRPELAGQPVVVGGTSDRGVVASASYEARAYGIRSAMPSSRARRLCPHAVFVPGRFDRYQEVSRSINEIFRSFTPLVESISLDEAFLEVGGARRLHGPAEEIAHAIRGRIRTEHGLGCSVGVAAVKMVAKLASEAAKPRASFAGPVEGAGVVVVPPGGELRFLHPLPVGALWGVGPATRARLERFGVRTVGDLAEIPEARLVAALGEAQGRHLHALAWARDHRRVEPERPVKSVGHEETYAVDHHDPDRLAVEVVRLADAVASRLRRGGLAGRTVTLKVRFGDFRTITRSHTAEHPVDTGPELARAGALLLDQIDPRPGVRLLGLSVSGLTEGAGRQLSFDDTALRPAAAAAGAVDAIRARFGERSIGPGALLRAGGAGLRLRRTGDTRWGPDAEREDAR